MECKVGASDRWEVSEWGINRNIVECKGVRMKELTTYAKEY